MGNIGPLELLIVLVIVLVIFGPKRLPGLGKSAGHRDARVQGLDHRQADKDDDEDDGVQRAPAPRRGAAATAGTTAATHETSPSKQ